MHVRAAATDGTPAASPGHSVNQVLTITLNNQLKVEHEGIAECMSCLQDMEASGSRLDVIGVLATPDEGTMLLPCLLMGMRERLPDLQPGLWFIGRRRRSSAWAPTALLLLVATPSMFAEAAELQQQAKPGGATPSVLSHLAALLVLLSSQLLLSFHDSLSNHYASLLLSVTVRASESLLCCKARRSMHSCEAPSLVLVMQNAAAKRASSSALDGNSKAASLLLKDELRKWAATPQAATGNSKSNARVPANLQALLDQVFLDQALIAMPPPYTRDQTQGQPAASTEASSRVSNSIEPPSRAPSLGGLSRRSSCVLPANNEGSAPSAKHVAYAQSDIPAVRLNSVTAIQPQLAPKLSQGLPALHFDDVVKLATGCHSASVGPNNRQDVYNKQGGSYASPCKPAGCTAVANPPPLNPAFEQCLKQLLQRLEVDAQARHKHIMHHQLTPLLIRKAILAYVSLATGSPSSPGQNAHHFTKLPSVKLKRAASSRLIRLSSQNRSRPVSVHDSRPTSPTHQDTEPLQHAAAAATATSLAAAADGLAAAAQPVAVDHSMQSDNTNTGAQQTAGGAHTEGHRPVPRKASRLRIAPCSPTGSQRASTPPLQPVPELPLVWDAMNNLEAQGALQAYVLEYQERMSVLTAPRDLTCAPALHKQSWEAVRRQYLDATTDPHSNPSAGGLRELRQQCQAAYQQLLQQLQAAAAADKDRPGHRYRNRLVSAQRRTSHSGAPAGLGHTPSNDTHAAGGVLASNHLANNTMVHAGGSTSGLLHGRSRSSLSVGRIRRRLKMHDVGLLVDSAARHKLQNAEQLGHVRASFAFLPRLGSFRACPAKDSLSAVAANNTGGVAAAGSATCKTGPAKEEQADADFARMPELRATFKLWEDHAAAPRRSRCGHGVLPGIRRT